VKKSITVRELLAKARWQLSSVTETPELDSQVLLCHVLGQPRVWLYAHPEAAPTTEQTERYAQLLAAMSSGTPLPYLTGHREFYGLEFFVNPAVLIPRPETELCVALAVDWCSRHSGNRLAADVGTGSGCLAVALASQVPDLRVLASDLSFQALLVARRNIVQHGLHHRIQPLQADLLPEVARPFDLICANLPYIPTATLVELPVFRQEPVMALDGGSDGLDLIRRLLAAAPSALANPGCLLLEIEASQGPAALALAGSAFPSAHVRIEKDLAGHDRVIIVEQSASP
jgi:release factor glutamine methyltransferase